jgi:hypothetical protein
VLVETGGVRVYMPGRSNLGAATKRERDKSLRNLNRAIGTRMRGSRDSLERLKAFVVHCGVFQQIIVPVRTAKPRDNTKKAPVNAGAFFDCETQKGASSALSFNWLTEQSVRSMSSRTCPKYLA